MLSFYDFFAACAGHWRTERTYHSVLTGDVERSYTEFQVESLLLADKQQILAIANPAAAPLQVSWAQVEKDETMCPGFAIAFETRSETGEEVAMQLRALFVPDQLVLSPETVAQFPPSPQAAQVAASKSGDMIQGFYLRDQGYSEAGAIAGRFTYQAIRQTLEMTTYYRRSVAVDQMRLLKPDLRLRTIVNYQRSQSDESPSIIDLIGFGMEQKA